MKSPSRDRDGPSGNSTGTGTTSDLSPWSRMLKSGSDWPDKEEFLDVIYWIRQVVGILLGLIWGVVPFTGFFGIALFCAINAGGMYVYFSSFQKIDEEEYGGAWELTKEGFMTSFAGFLVTWTIMYSGLHFTELHIQNFGSS